MWAYVVLAFAGRKTYFVAFGAAIYAALSVFYGEMTWQQALEWFVTAGLAATIRSGVKGEIKKTVPESVQPPSPEPIPGEGKPRIHRIPLVIGKIILKKLLPF